MQNLGFLEFQPNLTSSSPEGARDFLVPNGRQENFMPYLKHATI